MGLIELIESFPSLSSKDRSTTFLPNSVALCGSDGEVSDLEEADIVFVYDNGFLVTKKLLEESETQLKEEERSSSGHPT